MKKFKKILSIINYIWIIIILIYMFIGSLAVSFFKFKLGMYANVFYILNIISLILCILNYIFKGKFKYTDLFIFILIFIALLSTYMSDYKEVAIWGLKTRCEGMIMIICYYLLYLLSTYINNKDKRYILITILSLGVIQVFIGILQQERILKGYTELYVRGLVGNSNFYSTQNLIWLGLSLGLFIFSKKYLYIPLIFIFSVGLFLGGAMSCIVGLLCIIVSIIVIFIVNRKYLNIKECIIKFIISILVIIGTVIFTGLVTNNPLINDLKELFVQSSDVVINHEVSDNYGTGRIEIWKKTIPKVKDYFWIGIGIDCFKYIFKPFFVNEAGIVTKAHNEYLQYLITEGIYCLSFYLLLILFSTMNNIKRSRDNNYNYKDYAYLLCIIGYITQAFFNISVIRVAPIYYIVLGLCIKRNLEDNLNEK